MLTNLLIVAAILFCIGALGFLTRRNMIVMFLSVEMMLQGVGLNLVAMGRAWGSLDGQIFTIFVLTVAAAEAGIALALIVVLYRRANSLDISVWQDLREPGQPPVEDEAETEAVPIVQTWTRLPQAGVEPGQSEPQGSQEPANV